MRTQLFGIALAAMLAVAAAARPAAAQSGGGFDLTWNKVAAGGVSTSSGGAFTLGGTAGQPDAAWLSGGTFRLYGGFWQGVALRQLLDVPPPPAPAAVFALHGFTENPVRASRLQVTFSLAEARPARLELLDVAGRRVASHESGAFDAGTHTVTLTSATPVRPGVYFVRLTQGERTLVRKGVVVR